MAEMSQVYAMVQIDCGLFKDRFGAKEAFELAQRLERGGLYYVEDPYPGVYSVLVETYEVSEESSEWISTGGELEDVGRFVGAGWYHGGDPYTMWDTVFNTPGMLSYLPYYLRHKTRRLIRNLKERMKHGSA